MRPRVYLEIPLINAAALVFCFAFGSSEPLVLFPLDKTLAGEERGLLPLRSPRGQSPCTVQAVAEGVRAAIGGPEGSQWESGMRCGVGKQIACEQAGPRAQGPPRRLEANGEAGRPLASRGAGPDDWRGGSTAGAVSGAPARLRAELVA